MTTKKKPIRMSPDALKAIRSLMPKLATATAEVARAEAKRNELSAEIDLVRAREFQKVDALAETHGLCFECGLIFPRTDPLVCPECSRPKQ